MYAYLIGLIIGLGVYAITYVFAKQVANEIRVLIVAVAGILLSAISLMIIGGFQGIPFLILSLGVISVASLFGFFGRSLLGKKIVFTSVLLIVVSYSVFMYFNQTDYYIVSKSLRYGYDGEVGAYVKKIEEDTATRGYKVFPFSEGDKAIVLSLGGEMTGNNIEVLGVEEKNGQTSITIRTFYNQSKEENPYIIIGLDKVQSKILIRDTDGTVYEENND